MNKIYVSTINEVEKILYKKKTAALMIFSIFAPGILALSASIIQKRIGILAFGSADFPIWVLGFFTSVILPLFIFMWSADSFAGEIEDQSLKIALLRPLTRFKVYLSKNIAIVVCVLFTLLIVFIFSELAGLFLAIMGKGFLTNLVRSLSAYILAVVPLLTITVLAGFLAQLVRSSSGVLAISVLVYIIAKVLPIISPGLANLTLAAYTNWHLLWLTPSISWNVINQALMVMLASCLIFFPIGYFLFDRKDL